MRRILTRAGALWQGQLSADVVGVEEGQKGAFLDEEVAYAHLNRFENAAFDGAVLAKRSEEPLEARMDVIGGLLEAKREDRCRGSLVPDRADDTAGERRHELVEGGGVVRQ